MKYDAAPQVHGSWVILPPPSQACAVSLSTVRPVMRSHKEFDNQDSRACKGVFDPFVC